MFDDFDTPVLADAATPSLPQPNGMEPATPHDRSAAAGGFAVFGLAEPLLRAVADRGYTEPTPVQRAAIVRALGGSAAPDLMVSSQTGSGKTAAYLLPVLHRLLQGGASDGNSAAAHRRGPPRRIAPGRPGALVLCPTRELALQVAAEAIELVRPVRGLRIAQVIGGTPYAQQVQRLSGAALVIATPGRLLDLHRSGSLRLDAVQALVVDEADRMLDLGFADDLAEIHQLTVQRAQTLMFSATFAPRIQQLAARVMRPGAIERLQIDSPQEQHANIRQLMHWADGREHKRALLDHWLRDTTLGQAIVFAGTQVECDELAEDLQQAGFAATGLHGALGQGLRNRRLAALRDGRVQILVATDVAARGIDVPGITHVFNYGLPMKAEDYTHRIGRTGRAGRDGVAVTFAEARDRRRLGDIEAFTRQRLRAEVIPGLEPRAPRPHPGGRPAGKPGAKPGFRANNGQRQGPERAGSYRKSSESRHGRR